MSLHNSCLVTVQETDLLFDGIPVRLYEPVGRSGDLAGIVYYHGGGWVFGSLGMASLTFCSLVLCCAHAVFQLLSLTAAPPPSGLATMPSV